MNPQQNKVAIIGAGLAGCEAAWQLAKRNVPTTLFEMRPSKSTAAHKTGDFAELVCSNSFKSMDIANAHGLLKAELHVAGSLIIDSAHQSSLPAGGALAVDRKDFSQHVFSQLKNLKDFNVVQEEICDLEPLFDKFSQIIIAAGPLCSDGLAISIQSILKDQGLYFYDAIAPTLYTESIDMKIAFKEARYGKGEADYINCPMDQREYENFIEALIGSEKIPFNNDEKKKHFEGCLPIEVMAERGPDTLAYGPLKPVGFTDPRTGKRPWAILQLRQENVSGSLQGMVGCQTRMTWPEQKRIFRMIPGLQTCEFARLGSMHRNTYINAPLHLTTDLECKLRPNLFFAGQITGTEGYTESTASGLWAAMSILSKHNIIPSRKVQGETMIGSLIGYLNSASTENFQPMNANFGLMESISKKVIRNKKERRTFIAHRAINTWKEELQRIGF